MSSRTGYLLDTNVVSETRRVRPDAGVGSFLATLDSDSLFISVLTLGELRKGVAVKHGIEFSFADRVLSIDIPTAQRWGELSADRNRPVIDTLIAATALVHDLTLVTRNRGDLHGIDVPLVNPWRSST